MDSITKIIIEYNKQKHITLQPLLLVGLLLLVLAKISGFEVWDVTSGFKFGGLIAIYNKYCMQVRK